MNICFNALLIVVVIIDVGGSIALSIRISSFSVHESVGSVFKHTTLNQSTFPLPTFSLASNIFQLLKVFCSFPFEIIIG